MGIGKSTSDATDQQYYQSLDIKLSGDVENNFRSQHQAHRTSQHQSAAYKKGDTLSALLFCTFPSSHQS